MCFAKGVPSCDPRVWVGSRKGGAWQPHRLDPTCEFPNQSLSTGIIAENGTFLASVRRNDPLFLFQNVRLPGGGSGEPCPAPPPPPPPRSSGGSPGGHLGGNFGCFFLKKLIKIKKNIEQINKNTKKQRTTHVFPNNQKKNYEKH